MKGLILINAYYDAPAYTHQYTRIAEELKKAGAACEVRRNDFFPAYIDGGMVKRAAESYDFCVYLDKDKYVSELLEKSGLRLFNPHAAVAACDDKMRTFARLADHGIPMPRTLPGLLCYTPSAKVREETAIKIESALGYPVIVKTSHGSMGKGVYKADDRAELLSLMEEVKLSPHLYQKFVAASAGRDLRVMVVGGKTIGGMLRRADNDFRSNVGAGGHGELYNVNADTADLCEKIAAVLGLDFCGIDLLFGANGFELCEVNSNAFFAEFEAVTGINAAGAIARHVLHVMHNA